MHVLKSLRYSQIVVDTMSQATSTGRVALRLLSANFKWQFIRRGKPEP